jgi:hypothetical protein
MSETLKSGTSKLDAVELDEVETDVRLDGGLELEASEDVAPHETRNKLNEVQRRLDLFIKITFFLSHLIKIKCIDNISPY